jgi:4-hydroxybenzoate polyprenyltransferase
MPPASRDLPATEVTNVPAATAVTPPARPADPADGNHSVHPATAASTSRGRESFLSGLREFLAERFPVPVTAMLSAAVGVAAYVAAQADTLRAGAPLILDGTAALGCVLVFLFLLQLRVFDEHKDFAQDSETRPDRPVQRGLVTLDELKAIGAVAIVAQVVLAFLPGATAGLAYLVVLGYSALMLVEFFAREWLSRRMLWYAFTHTLVMSILAVALSARFTARAELSLPVEVWVLGLLCLPVFFSVDVLRKMWAPENEVEGVDSYTDRLGYRGAALLAVAILVTSAALGGWLGWQLGGRAVWLAVVAAATAWGAWEVRSFARDPRPSGEKRLQAVAGVHLFVLFFGFAVVAATAHGAVFALGENAWLLNR